MKRKSLIIMITIIIIVVAALGIGGTIVVKKYILKTDPGTTTTKTVVKKGLPLELGDFTVNLQDGTFLKANVTLAVVDEKAQTSLKAEEAYLKDKVNMVLLTKNREEVQRPDGIVKIKKELITKLNEIAEDKVVDVLFSTWASQ